MVHAEHSIELTLDDPVGRACGSCGPETSAAPSTKRRSDWTAGAMTSATVILPPVRHIAKILDSAALGKELGWPGKATPRCSRTETGPVTTAWIFPHLASATDSSALQWHVCAEASPGLPRANASLAPMTRYSTPVGRSELSRAADDFSSDSGRIAAGGSRPSLLEVLDICL